MNQNVRSFIQKYVEPNNEYIKSRSYVLSLNLPSNLPNFVLKRFEDIKLLILIGSDSTVMKLIPNFLEELFISLLVSEKTNSQNEYYSQHRKIETMDAKKIYGKLKELNVFKKEDLDFCQRYFGESNLRNKEIHNKEIRIFEGLGGLELINPDTGQKSEADEAVVNLIKSSPELLRGLNHNDRVSRVQVETFALFGFIINNVDRLAKLNHLPNEETEEYLNSQPKSKKMLLTLFNKTFISKVEKAIQTHPEIVSYEKVGDDTLKLEYKTDITAADASYYFLPITNGNFKMKPI